MKDEIEATRAANSIPKRRTAYFGPAKDDSDMEKKKTLVRSDECRRRDRESRDYSHLHSEIN